MESFKKIQKIYKQILVIKEYMEDYEMNIVIVGNKDALLIG